MTAIIVEGWNKKNGNSLNGDSSGIPQTPHRIFTIQLEYVIK